MGGVGLDPPSASSRNRRYQGERQWTMAQDTDDVLAVKSVENEHCSDTLAAAASLARDLPDQPSSRGTLPAAAFQAVNVQAEAQHKYWAEEIVLIRESLSAAFGRDTAAAMMMKWDLTADRHELHALEQHATCNGKPLGYALLSKKDTTAIDLLIAANKSMKPDDMEQAATKFCPSSTWAHRDVYDALAVAESEDDGELVRKMLFNYAERLVPTGEWDPAVLLAAARAQPVQGWSGNVKQILLALYRALFQGQAEALMTGDDVDFLDNFGLCEGGLFTLSGQDSVTRKDVNQMWQELKQEEGIESVSMDKLMKYVGIRQVKEQALSLLKKMLSDRKLTAKQRVVTSCNFTFMGNPGTGETLLLIQLLLMLVCCCCCFCC